MATTSLRQVGNSIIDLKDNVEKMMRGELPLSLIDKNDFEIILRSIKRKMPSKYTLPYSLRRMSDYYKFIPVHLISNGTSIMLALTIPLLTAKSNYELIEGVQVPTLQNGRVVQYNWPSNFVAVSRERNEFINVNKDEALSCSRHSQICLNTNPVFNSMTLPNCMVSLINQRSTKLCTESVVENPQITVKHLFDGKWILFLPERQEVNVDCEGYEADRMISFPSGNLLFDQAPNCQARSMSFTLPARFRDTSSSNVIDFFDIQMNRFANFRETHKIRIFDTKNESDSIPPLDKILGQVDGETIKNLLGKYKWHAYGSGPALWVLIVIGVLFSVLIVTVLIVVVQWYRHKYQTAASTVRARRLRGPPKESIYDNISPRPSLLALDDPEDVVMH